MNAPLDPLLAHAHFGNLTVLEWVVVSLAALAAAWTIWKTVAYTLRPGEEAPDHIKRLILSPEPLPAPSSDPLRGPPPEARP